MVVRKGMGEDGRGQIWHRQEHPDNLFSSHMEVWVLHQTFNTYSLPQTYELVSHLCYKIENRLRRVRNQPKQSARKEPSRDSKPDLPVLLTIK